MDPTSFDELTKALASSTSRRHALRTIVTASVGSLFGLGGITTVFGGPKTNKNCKKWCAQVFGPNTSAARQCTSDAAHGGGLCAQCGSVAPSSICCVRNTSLYCNGTSAATCCASGLHCCSGTCSECCANTDCLNDNTCSSSHTCVCGSGVACTGSNTCVAGLCCANGDVCTSNTGSKTCCASDQTCNNGTCCIANNGSCTSDDQCCSNVCDNFTGTCVTCIASGERGCDSTTDCCPGNVCDTTTSTCVACIPNNDSGCTSNSDCCSGVCSSGTCICSASGTTCSSNSNCCSGLVCDTATSTCVACVVDNDCNSGQTCVNNSCCTPNCTGKTCGDNLCLGSCEPGCSTGQTCNNGACCIAAAGPCTMNADCCSKICNPITMTCDSCVPSGGGCNFNTDCCSGNCSIAPMAIAGHCCDSLHTYVGGTCCPNANVCGSHCCQPGQTCLNGLCGAGCFVAGTPIVMAGGYHKFIDSIQVGDTILAWNEDTRQIFPTTVVEALHHEETMQTLFEIELEDRRRVTVNDNHPMYVAEDERFIVSRELPGRFGNGKPITFLGNNNEPVKLVSLRTRTERCKVYNLHVQGQGEKGHTYFANGILVHNKNG